MSITFRDSPNTAQPGEIIHLPSRTNTPYWTALDSTIPRSAERETWFVDWMYETIADILDFFNLWHDQDCRC